MLRKHVNTSLVSVLKLFIVVGCYVGFPLISSPLFSVDQICPAEEARRPVAKESEASRAKAADGVHI